ncbi:MAG: MoaD/ThiS family protein [Thermocladium sp.]
MRIKVWFLATLFNLAGDLWINMAVPDRATINDLLQAISNIKPAVIHAVMDGERLKRDYIITVNGRDIAFLSGSMTVLREGDEVAMFPSLILS